MLEPDYWTGGGPQYTDVGALDEWGCESDIGYEYVIDEYLV
jgi:hypothetical protein